MPINPECADPRPCPHCGAQIVPVPILYGMPSPEAFQAAERGELELGGCVIGEESPEYRCPGCHATLPWVSERWQRSAVFGEFLEGELVGVHINLDPPMDDDAERDDDD